MIRSLPPPHAVCHPRFVRSPIILLAMILCLMSCKASVRADINTSKNQEEEDPFADWKDIPSRPRAEFVTEYFGVARRLTLQPGSRPANCQCVAAVLGSGYEDDFDWHGERPGLGLDAMVVAISTEGIACEHRGRGPSIAAIDQDGPNVVVVLEEFRDTRPIALGAIIPNPGPTGSVFLRHRGNIPYGRPLSNSTHRHLCKIGEGSALGTSGQP